MTHNVWVSKTYNWWRLQDSWYSTCCGDQWRKNTQSSETTKGKVVTREDHARKRKKAGERSYLSHLPHQDILVSFRWREGRRESVRPRGGLVRRVYSCYTSWLWRRQWRRRSSGDVKRVAYCVLGHIIYELWCVCVSVCVHYNLDISVRITVSS